MNQSGAYAEVPFRLRIAPQWQHILAVLQQRAQQAKLKWPSGLKPGRLPRVYALSLNGVQGPQGTVGPVQALLWQPPQECALDPPFATLSAVCVDFGVAAKRAFRDANEGVEVPFAALSLYLDATGLWLPTVDNLPGQRLANIPLPAVVHTFYEVATGIKQLEPAGADFIVDKFHAPPELEELRISRWRGDASHRLTTQAVQMELWMA